MDEEKYLEDRIEKHIADELQDVDLYDGIPCECTYPGEDDGDGRCCNCGGWLN